MKKNYSKPSTKTVSLNVSSSVMSEAPVVSSEPNGSPTPLSDEPAPMF